MTTFSSKLARVRSVKLTGFGHKSRSSPDPPPPKPTHHASADKLSVPMVLDNRSSPNLSTNTTTLKASNSFRDTLRAISKEAQSGEFADVFDAFFFSDKRCQNRAFFMAARLKQALQTLVRNSSHSSARMPLLSVHPVPVVSRSSPTSSAFSTSPTTSAAEPPSWHTSHADTSLWQQMTHRLYTLNYILFVLPPTTPARARFLDVLERQLAQIGDGQQVLLRGGMEAHFVVRYTLRKYMQTKRSMGGRGLEDTLDIEDLVERGRAILEHCLESESKLGHSERDAMYVFHGLRMGLLGTFEPQIDLEEDPDLAVILRDLVRDTKSLAKPAYINPFEDDEAVVTEEDDTNEISRPEQVEYGFHDNFVPTITTTPL